MEVVSIKILYANETAVSQLSLSVPHLLRCFASQCDTSLTQNMLSLCR